MTHTQSKPTDLRSPELAELVEKLSARLEAGREINWDEVEREFPEHAAAARALLPTLQRLAELSRASGSTTPNGEPVPLGELGDYRIIREIGRGGMGVVYQAEQISLSRMVALKVLPFAAVMDPRHLQRFKNEARAAASLDHPNVVKVYGVGCERGVHFIALQFVDGRSMGQLIRERRGDQIPGAVGHANATCTFSKDVTDRHPKVAHSKTTCSRIPLDAAFIRQATEWGIRAADALEHAHSLGIVHRDVKPGNLLIDGRGEVFVADFGLAKVATDPGITGTGDMLGTLRYMSPEQAGAQYDLVDHRSDIYSLGVTLYELLTLAPAFPGESREALLSKIIKSDAISPRKIDRRIPTDLETIILKAMEKDPSRRYRTEKELADDLRRFLDSQPVKARRAGVLDRIGKWSRRNRAAVVGVVMVMLTTLAAVAGSVGWAARDRAERRRDAERRIDDGITEVERLHGRGKWQAAREAVISLEPLLAGGGVSADRAKRVHGWQKDLDLLNRLTEIRLQASSFRDDYFDWEPSDEQYMTAFRDYGIDADVLDPSIAAEQIRDRPIRLEVAAALESWAYVRRGKLTTRRQDYKTEWRRLLKVARDADPDPTRVRVRNAILAHDVPTLLEFARSATNNNLTPSTLFTLALALDQSQETAGAVGLLRRAQIRYPDDFYLNSLLVELLTKLTPRPREEELRIRTSIVSILPSSPGARANLAKTYNEQGRLTEAEACFREAIRLDPNHAIAHAELGGTLAELGKSAEAEARCREALRLSSNYAKPHNYLAAAHNHLAIALGVQGKFEEAEENCREAIRLVPTYGQAHANLGLALMKLGKLDDAVVSYRESIRLRPNGVSSRTNLGVALHMLNRWEEAEVVLREAILYDPDCAEAHCNLGGVLQDWGRYEESLIEYKTGHALGRKRQNWKYPSADWLGKAEKLVALEKKLLKMVADKGRPADLREALDLADVALRRRWSAVSARLYADAFRADPKLANRINDARFNAAGAAALAGCGHGKDPVKPTDDERAQFRKQALRWLTAELEQLSLAAAEPDNGAAMIFLLRHWHSDSDFTCVRDGPELKKLPEAEQAEWRKLWADVAALQKRLEPPAAAPPPRPK